MKKISGGRELRRKPAKSWNKNTFSDGPGDCLEFSTKFLNLNPAAVTSHRHGKTIRWQRFVVLSAAMLNGAVEED